MHMTTLLVSSVLLDLLPFAPLRVKNSSSETAAAQTPTAVGHSGQAITQEHCPTHAGLCGYTGACLISLTFNADKCTK